MADNASRRRVVPRTAAVALLVLGFISTVDALAIFRRDMARRDFGAFHNSGAAWRAGANAYATGRLDLPNLNPPSAIAVIFAPLSRLPLPAAALLWQLLGTASLGYCAWRIGRTAGLEPFAAVWTAGVGLLSVAARYVWLEGQMTWLLLVPATHAWLAYRRGAHGTAGLLLGPVVAIKPFFAVAAVALGGRTAVTAALASATLTLASIPLTGLAPWRAWMALGPEVSVTWPSSASLWTVGTRFVGATPLETVTWTALPAALVAAIALALCMLLLCTWRLNDRDARWASAIALALLASPLGWIYYLPLAAGALVTLWSSGRWSVALTTAVCACCLPMDLLFRAIAGGWWSGISAGAAYTWALIAIVVGQSETGPRGPGARRSAPITDRESTGTQAAS